MSFSNDFDDAFEHAPVSTFLELSPAGAKKGDDMYVHIVPSAETLGSSMALTVPTAFADQLRAHIHKIVDDCNAMLAALDAKA